MIAAIDLGGTRTKFGIVDGANVLAADAYDAEPGGSLVAHLDSVIAGLADLCRANSLSLQECRGLGVLSTGLVDNVRMRVLSTNQKYDDAVDFDFVTWSRKNNGLALRLENDARGALIGEWRFGAGKGVDNLLMITLGTGVGCAAVCDGRPLVGPDFSAGILGGHIVINPGGRACTCGGFGHLESEASGWVLSTLLRENPDFAHSPLRDVENPDFRTLRRHVAEGDACARTVWTYCLETWGAGLVSLVHMVNPQRVIIGGGVVNDPDGILESFRRSFDRFSWNGSAPVEFVCAAHPDHAGLIGAGSLFL